MLLLLVKWALQRGLTVLLKSVDRLFGVVGGVFCIKIIRCFHQVIQGGNVDEETYYL